MQKKKVKTAKEILKYSNLMWNQIELEIEF